MGGSVPVVQMGMKSLRPAITRSNQMAGFYDDIIDTAVADLNENGSPITAEVFQQIVSDMKRKDARGAIAPDALPEEPAAEETETSLPSGIIADPQMDLDLQEKANPDTVALAVNETLASKTDPVVSGADPTTVEAKGGLMQQMDLPVEESSSVENSDHQAVRDLITPAPKAGVAEEALPPQRTKILDPARASEAEAVETRFGQQVAQIKKAKDLYVKMEREASATEITGDSSVGQALQQRVREGKAVSPAQADELIGAAFKERVIARSKLMVEQGVALEEVTQDPAESEAIDRLIASGYQHVLTPAKLKRLGIPINQRTTSEAFIRAANAKIADGIAQRFTKLSVARPEGGMSLNSAYGEGKVFLDRFGVGQFNNDPLTMLSLLEQGIPIIVPQKVNTGKINPAFRFAELGDTLFVTDIMVPESGGLVSALTPADRALSLRPDYTRLVKLVERVTNLRAGGLANPEALVPNPFHMQGKPFPYNPDEKISNQEILERLETNDAVEPFLKPTKGELSPEFTEAALLDLRLSAIEALFGGLPMSRTLQWLGGTVANAYVAEQNARLKHQKESFVSTISVNEAAALQADPDFNPPTEVEDTYTPLSEAPLPPFAPSRIAEVFKDVQSNAVAAMTGDSALRQSVVSIVQTEVFASTSIDFNRTSNETLWGHFINWMAQGNSKSNAASLQFQKALKTRQFEMAAPVREALQLMGLSSSSIEGTPKTNAAYMMLIKDTVQKLKGAAPSDREASTFFNFVRESVSGLLLRSQPSGMSKAHDRMVNNNAITALGLKDGDPDSIIEALERIAGLSNRAQKEYDSHLVSLARLFLQSRGFIQTIEFSIDETD